MASLEVYYIIQIDYKNNIPFSHPRQGEVKFNSFLEMFLSE